MSVCLVHSRGLADYDLGPEHPLRPERFTLAVELMEAYGLLSPPASPGPRTLRVVEPSIASDDDLALAHDRAYISAVREASDHEGWFSLLAGIGTADTPAFPGMHEAAALVAGATSLAIDEVLSGRHMRALSVAGGLHHAHRDRAAGFCVYNDAAVGIARALRETPDLRVTYVDIDAHHGDGVQEAFYGDPRVLTVSVHESGHALYPGTGFTDERGRGDGVGFAANVPLPPFATDACYRMAFEDAVGPIVRAFAPDLIVAQCGGDAHHEDPLTALGLTIGGHSWLTAHLVSLADELCAGRLVALGGGGYGWEHAVPRMWTLLAANLVGLDLPDAIPEAWRSRVRTVAEVDPPASLRADSFEVTDEVEAQLLNATRQSIESLKEGPQPSRA